MCSNGEKEYVVVSEEHPKGNWFSTKESAEEFSKAMPEECTIKEEQIDCGECLECSSFCDVCGSWYHDDEPCEMH